jgi:GH24 family phage-related lysozyme (muramidase)
MPERIQRKRTKGWRMPEGAVYVGRGSTWGNPWRVGDDHSWTIGPGRTINREPHGPLTREQCVESYRNAHSDDPEWEAILREKLGGKNLACWCPLDQPCHADVLLELANRDDHA